MFFVTMTDKALSGWGMARGKVNKLVLSCDTLEEAERVERYAKTRSEMRYVNIVTKKPSYNSNRYYVSWHNKESYPRWYE